MFAGGSGHLIRRERKIMAMVVLDYMVMIYANLVKAKVRTIDSLPEIYKDPVEKYMAANP